MSAEYSSLHREPAGEAAVKPGGWKAGRSVKAISSHCATVLITLLVVTVLLLSMELAGRDNPSMATVQQVTPVSQWDAGSEYLREKQHHMTSVQLVNRSQSVSASGKNKLEQKFNKDLRSLAATEHHFPQASRGGAMASSCCSRVLISSTGLTQAWYPSILGVYSLQPGPGAPLYKMMDSQKFLYRPRRGKNRKFTWGVNNSPHLAWGWVKSGLPGKCPELLKKWAAFDPVKKHMRTDPTFRVSCQQP